MPWRNINFEQLAQEQLIAQTPPGPVSVTNTAPTTNAPATQLDDAALHSPASVASYARVADSGSESIPAIQERASFMRSLSQTTRRPSGPDDVVTRPTRRLALTPLAGSPFSPDATESPSSERSALDKFKRRATVSTSLRLSVSAWLDALARCNSERGEDAGGHDACFSCAAASREEDLNAPPTLPGWWAASADKDKSREDKTHVREKLAELG
ncbi:hypothetical protein T484DRAFT_1855283 [Baffinella frigidus]|nr:hypothetical protein T484DRAFT_1855283 [Cryptophyta sp. CCMP2293]